MVEVSDLRDRPELQATVADRLWTAWWRAEGSSLDEVTALVGASLGPQLVPTSFVAHDADRFLGTASLIVADLRIRPHYTPWLAAVWVEPDARRRGIGRAMVARVCAEAFAGGIDRVFLYCIPENTGFYVSLGWRLVEEDVGPSRVAILDRVRLDADLRSRP